MDDPEINEFVRAGLAQEWAPEQITGRMKQQDRDITHDQVRDVERRLNSRPRACLGFRNPNEVFHEKTPPAGCD